MYVRELRVQYRLRRIRGQGLSAQRLSTASEAAQAFTNLLRNEPIEVCGLFCLSTHHDVLAYHELSRGTLDATVVHPRDVFRIALLTNARAVIVGHNHPSGDPHPSAEDLNLTRRLVSAGELIGVDLLDHVIVAADRYVSLKESGHI